MSQINASASLGRLSTPAAGGRSEGQTTSGGLRLVEVADTELPKQEADSADAGGFLSIFVVRGGINMDEENANTNQR